MTRIYFDNAATTPLDPDVLAAMMPYFTTHFGNPSSIYSYGRETRMAIETARKTVARILQAQPAEIFFTSGGTESNNTAITASVRDLGCQHIITSAIEHHATLHVVDYLVKKGKATSDFVQLLPNGQIDLLHLEQLLQQQSKKCLVTLMHANNEIGNMLDIHQVGTLCQQYNAIFHTDTVQTVGHFPFSLQSLPVHFITGAGHKFHGPKGVGMLYINQQIKIQPFLHGGGQERNMRAGTENIYGIVGFAKALELATQHFEQDSAYIQSLKNYLIQQLALQIPSATFNGDYLGNSLYTVLSVGLPKTAKSEMILYNLDINNICVSGGSACSSGADVGSHVIKAVYPNMDKVTIRFSFSKWNTTAEIDEVIVKLKTML